MSLRYFVRIVMRSVTHLKKKCCMCLFYLSAYIYSKPCMEMTLLLECFEYSMQICVYICIGFSYLNNHLPKHFTIALGVGTTV